jgi:hypothetical protein
VGGLEAIKIVTRCTSRAQFVAMFRKFCDATSCFIPSPTTRPAGLATAFSIRLADNTALLRGHGVVLESWSTADNPFKRPGVHLGIHQLTNDSLDLFDELVMPRSTATRVPLAHQLRLMHETVPMVAAQLETPTIEMPPLEKLDAPRLPPAEFTLPANPLTDMSDDMLDTFIESSLDAQDAVPAEALADLTERTRGPVATILGMMPLAPPKVYAAPMLVQTERVGRIVSPVRSSRLGWSVAIAVVTLLAATIALASVTHAAPADRASSAPAD